MDRSHRTHFGRPSNHEEAKSGDGTLIAPTAIASCSPLTPFPEDALWSQVSPLDTQTLRSAPSSSLQAPMSGQLASPYVDGFAYHGLPTVQDSAPALMPELMNDNYPFSPPFFDVNSQYGSTTNSPHQYGIMFSSPVVWPQGAPAAPGDSTGFLHAPPLHLGALPMTPGINNFEQGIQYFQTDQHQWEPSGSASPSTASSVAGTLSSGPFIDFSRHNSIHCLSPLPNNTFDATHINTIIEPGPAVVSGTAERAGQDQRQRQATASGSRDKWGTRKTAAATRTVPDAPTAYPSPTHTHKSNTPWPTNEVVAMPREFAHPLAVPSGLPTSQAVNQAANQAANRPKVIMPPRDKGAVQKSAHPEAQRQRNRRAATKCRAKTKKAAVELELKERVLTAAHADLSKTVKELRDEVLALKSELLRHGNCDSEVIQQYLQKATRKIAADFGKAGSSPKRSRRVLP